MGQINNKKVAKIVMAAARRPILCCLALAACLWLLQSPAQQETFVASSGRSLRVASDVSSAFAGATAETKAVPTVVIMHGLPEPRANPYNLPVELNRTSFYWGLLTI